MKSCESHELLEQEHIVGEGFFKKVHDCWRQVTKTKHLTFIITEDPTV